MSSAAELHMLYRIGNAPVNPFPYPHFYVRDVFPPDFYAELQRHMPPREALSPISEVRHVAPTYGKTRSVLILDPESVGKMPEPLRRFWAQTAQMLLDGSLGHLLMSKFAQPIETRFAGQANLEFSDEALLVQDYPNYALGPHTDAPSKVFSLLFYLPADDSQPHLGTSIYVPKEVGFTCPGGPHHPVERFHRMTTMPYVPNSAFGFVKTPNAFHGVETVTKADAQRTLLLYDIRYRAPQAAAPAPQTPAVPTAQFKF
jgi:hypothetical protein